MTRTSKLSLRLW